MLDVTPHLRDERNALIELLRSLTPDQWATSTECPEWDVKGIALHVLGDDLSLLSRQRDRATNSLALYAKDHPEAGFRELLDGFNNSWVRTAMFFSTRIVIELLALTGRWTSDYYASLDPEGQSNERVGFFAATAESPWWEVSAREYAERWIHQQQIRRALGRETIGEDLSWPAMEAIVIALGRRHTSLGLFRIGSRTWEFRVGDEIALDPDRADLVLSCGLSFPDAMRAFDGDPALVQVVAHQVSRARYHPEVSRR